MYITETIKHNSNSEILKNTTRELIMITPSIAFQWLGNNLSNRKVNKAHVSRLVEIIKDGRWGLSPNNCIIFDTNGVLLDGQHRLIAIIQADQPVSAFIERGWPNETKYYIDFESKSRTRADVISTLYKNNASQLSSFLTAASCIVNKTRVQNSPLSKQELILEILQEFDVEKVNKYLKTIIGKAKQGDTSQSCYFPAVFYFLDEIGIPVDILEKISDQIFLGIGLISPQSLEYRLNKMLKSREESTNRGYMDSYYPFWNLLISYLKKAELIKSEEDLQQRIKNICPPSIIG